MSTKFITDTGNIGFYRKVFNIVKNWKQTKFESCMAVARAFGRFFVILSGAGCFWAISDYFMIYTIIRFIFSMYIRTI